MIPAPENSASELDEPADAVLVEPAAPKQPRFVRSVCALSVLVTLLFPVFFGGKEPAVFRIVQILLIAAGLWGAARNLRAPLSKLERIVPLTVLIMGLASIQLVPLPLGLLQLLSAQTAELYASAGRSTGTLTLDRFLTLESLVWFSALALYLFVLLGLPYESLKQAIPSRLKSRRHGRHPLYERARETDRVVDLLERAIIGSGFVCAIIALGHLSTGTGYLFGLFAPNESAINLSRVHWPFVNPNHLCVLLEMSVILGLGRFFRLNYLKAMKDPSKEPVRLSVRLLRSPERLGMELTHLFVALVMTICAILTLSRTGIFLLVAGILWYWLYCDAMGARLRVRPYLASRPRRGVTVGRLISAERWERWRRPFIVTTTAFLVLFLLSQGGRDLLAKRIEYGLTAEQSELRWKLNEATLKMLGDSPLFGVGLGNWRLGVARHVDRELAAFTLDYAHNDPLQFVAEMGLAGAAVLVLCCVWFAKTLRRGLNSVTLPTQRVHLVGLALALLLPILHSLLDFPFHIPALAVIFAGLLAAYLRAVSFYTAESTVEE